MSAGTPSFRTRMADVADRPGRPAAGRHLEIGCRGARLAVPAPDPGTAPQRSCRDRMRDFEVENQVVPDWPAPGRDGTLGIPAEREGSGDGK